MKRLDIRTKKLKKKSVGSKAFQKTPSKAQVYVPAKKLKAYSNILKARGIRGKIMK